MLFLTYLFLSYLGSVLKLFWVVLALGWGDWALQLQSGARLFCNAQAPGCVGLSSCSTAAGTQARGVLPDQGWNMFPCTGEVLLIHLFLLYFF